MRIGLIGAGRWGRNHARVLDELGVLSVVCDASGDFSGLPPCTHARTPRMVTTSFEKALERCDAVVIATPAETHVDLALAALEAGKDVLVEKPASLDVAGAQALKAAQSDRILMVGHLLRYHPAVEHMLLLIAQQRDAGNVPRLIQATRAAPGTRRKVEDVTASFAPHDVSIILAALGMPETITRDLLLETNGVADATRMTLRYPGAVATVDVSWCAPIKRQELVVSYDDRAFVFDDRATYWDRKLTRIEDGAVFPCTSVEWQRPENEPLRRELEHFIWCCETRKAPLTDIDEAIDVMRVICGELPAETNATPEAPVGAFIHPTAEVEPGAELGEGVRIWRWTHVRRGARIGAGTSLGQGCYVAPSASIGRGCKVQNAVSIWDGVELGDDVFLGPGVTFTNVREPRADTPGRYEKTWVMDRASIGANATIRCGVIIGAGAMVGAGAVVLENVEPHTTVAGNPARVIQRHSYARSA